MRFARAQKGMSLLGWMVVLALVAFLASATFKMLPHYMDYMSLEKIITSAETEASQNINSVNTLYGHIARGLDVNNIRDFNLKESIQIKLENNEFLVHVQYERREPLIQNLDLVATFDKEFRIRAQ
jgi:type II secretory pathway pseudopilin PulG